MNRDDSSDVLVIAAHPDDSEFGAAGRWPSGSEGRRVAYLVCTSGEKGTTDPSLTPETLIGIREEEQRAAARVLGVQDPVFLRQPDQGLETPPNSASSSPHDPGIPA